MQYSCWPLTPLVYYVLATLAARCGFSGVLGATRTVRQLYTPPCERAQARPLGLDFPIHTKFLQVFAGRNIRTTRFCSPRERRRGRPRLPVIPANHIAEFPEREIRLLVGAEHFGANSKVNKPGAACAGSAGRIARI